MRLLEHKDNTPWRNAKVNDATAEQVAAFAKAFQRADAGAWSVAVAEYAGFVTADHVRHVVGKCAKDGVIAVWVSDGRQAQCVWKA